MVEEEEANCSIPRGGPIYVPNLISPLTTVPEFENLVLQQIQELEAELDLCQLIDSEDICVNDLKILKEEELVEMALKEAFKDEEHVGNDARHLGEESNSGGNAQLESSIVPSTSTESTKECHVAGSDGAAIEKKNGIKKRKRRKENNPLLENPYIEKVEQLAKIKQKQDEDKATASLHSLNAIKKINDSVVPYSDKIERMKSLRSMNSLGKMKPLDVEDRIPISYPEVVLCVEIYHNIRKSSKIQEFLVLGCQKLTELRDKIYCLTDQVMQKAGKHDPSGYFLIEDIFLNDMRDPSAIDYSKPIFDWLNNSNNDAHKKWDSLISGDLLQKQRDVLGSLKPSMLPHFRAVNMNTTRFCDLRFQLGAGYLYCHQGDCKHTIVIRDMRLIHPDDVFNRAAYPIMIFQLKLRVQKCNVCKINRATKVTVDDKWATENPCYFCDECFVLLHYENETPTYGEFSVYDYVHD